MLLLNVNVKVNVTDPGVGGVHSYVLSRSLAIGTFKYSASAQKLITITGKHMTIVGTPPSLPRPHKAIVVR